MLNSACADLDVPLILKSVSTLNDTEKLWILSLSSAPSSGLLDFAKTVKLNSETGSSSSPEKGCRNAQVVI